MTFRPPDKIKGSFLIFLNRVSEYPKTKVNEIEADEYCLQQLKEL